MQRLTNLDSIESQFAAAATRRGQTPEEFEICCHKSPVPAHRLCGMIPTLIRIIKASFPKEFISKEAQDGTV